MRKCCFVLLLATLVLIPGVWRPALAVAAAQPGTAPGPSLQAGQAKPPAPPPQVPSQPAGTGRILWCGREIGPPSSLPPSGSGPVVYLLGACFPDQGGVSVIEPETYLYYIQLKPSRPSTGQWTAWNEQTEKTVFDDFKRLWGTNFLDNLSIEVTDYPFSNGVTGKLVAYNMEERQRVKIVDYEGAKHLEQTKIDEKLKEENASIRLDSFIDPSLVRKVKKVVLDMLAEKGYQFATVNPEIKPLPGGPKLVNLTFKVDEGPQVKIRQVQFVGNKAVGNFALTRQMKNNRGKWFLSFITGHGTYQEAKYEEDADKIVGYYRDHGYIAARVGDPELKYIEDSPNRRTRWVQLRIPITEGERYRVGNFTFDGNKVVKSESLRPMFKLKANDWYSDKAVRKGLEKSREAYGSGGYFEFTGYPDLQPRDEAGAAAAKAAEAGQKPVPPPVKPVVASHGKAPIVDVTMRMQEGKQYFINRIVFVGNTTTRDTVVRREMRLFEEGVFNTEALKYSIKRINQLAYFKPLEGGKDVDVQKTPGTDNKVDVTLKFEEQNRNQLTFGAGVSQFEGFFGQLGFQTANFMGRGETFGVNLQAGSRAQNYQISFSEPYLFDRAMTGGIDVFRRRIEYINQFTQKSTGGNLVFGFPLKDFTRMFINYSYEHTTVTDVNPLYTDPLVLASNPYLADSLLLGANGARTISKVVPSLVHNTVDNPIFPTTGRRYTLSIDLAGLGGDTNFYKPMAEGVWYFQHTKRTSFGFRAQAEYISQFSGSKALPVFEKLALGGEYSIRGFDIRSIGPKTETGLVLGGNKSLLFNAEYLISIAGPVRLVLFYDAGQVRDDGEKFLLKEFKTSTGAEVRFFMPVLNVPFRLIFAYDPQRDGILDNSLQPQKAFSFRFAVGSTF
ncbi:MAG TPA: outer membrane protein assembly factor BamA [Vicinamibacterales bacterium]|jgi:outer membrane protein insertion porin family